MNHAGCKNKRRHEETLWSVVDQHRELVETITHKLVRTSDRDVWTAVAAQQAYGKGMAWDSTSERAITRSGSRQRLYLAAPIRSTAPALVDSLSPTAKDWRCLGPLVELLCDAMCFRAVHDRKARQEKRELTAKTRRLLRNRNDQGRLCVSLRPRRLCGAFFLLIRGLTAALRLRG